MRRRAVPLAPAMSTSRLRRSGAILPIPRSSCMERTTGGRCSTALAASISTAQRRFDWRHRWRRIDDFYLCQPGGVPNRLYRIEATEPLRTSRKLGSASSKTRVRASCRCRQTTDGRTLIVVRANGPMLFLNEGGGKFRQKANAFQFATPPQGTFTSAAVADYDATAGSISLLPLRLLPGHGPIQVSVSLL